MKKIIAVLAMIGMTSVASAASFSWGTDIGNMVNAPDTTVFYLYQTAGTFGNGDFNNSNQQLGGLSAVGTYSQALTAGVMGVFTGYGYFEYDNGGGTIALGTQYAIVGWDAGSSATFGVGYLTIPAAIGDLDPMASYSVTGFDITQYTAVPEPTSMALLALGVAAVGLRRRFKK